ncbi:MAG: FAD-dependent oxidoreductase [Gemmatimonadota bacterium]
MDPPVISRREALRLGLLAASGGLLLGCAPRLAPRGVHPAPLGLRVEGGRLHLPRVHVSEDRIVRTVAGLRPFRPGGFVVSAERQDGKLLVHNYGHGGGGISLAWGSSELAVEEVRASGLAPGEAAVLGCGVMGLTTARLLQDRGWTVTIYARDLPPYTTSNVAGGQWSPFSVHSAGSTTPAYDAQFAQAARLSHARYQRMVGDGYGVRWVPNCVLSQTPQGGDRGALEGLFPGETVFGPGEHPFATPYLRVFHSLFVEPGVFLAALQRDFHLRGGRVEVREFHHLDEVHGLPQGVVVNCTGLGSRTLFGDEELVPVRGQVVHLLPQPEVDYILLGPGGHMFPRRDGIFLGGTNERDVWSLEPDPEMVQGLVERHREIFSGMAW